MLSLNKGQYSGKIITIHYLSGLTIGTTGYSGEENNCPLHYHENPHISFLLEGGHVEKRKNAEYERLPGDLMFCNGGEPHQFITKQFPSRNINLELDNDFLLQFEMPVSNIGEALTKNTDAKFLMLKMYKEMLTNDNYTEVSIQILLLHLINDAHVLTKQHRPRWVLLLQEILNDRWNEQLTLNELSTLTQVHPVTISRYFTKYFSCTLGEYMRKLKINKSIGLIRSQRLSLAEIAYICGFADQSHFIRTFKQITGWAPKKFQQL